LPGRVDYLCVAKALSAENLGAIFCMQARKKFF
jgi:hypothetical protein